MTEEMKEAYCYRVPELLPEEKNFPLAKFYTDYPLVKPGPLQQQVQDAGPMPVSEAIPVEHWLTSSIRRRRETSSTGTR